METENKDLAREVPRNFFLEGRTKGIIGWGGAGLDLGGGGNTPNQSCKVRILAFLIQLPASCDNPNLSTTQLDLTLQKLSLTSQPTYPPTIGTSAVTNLILTPVTTS